MSGNSSLYADAFSQARSPAQAFHAVDQRLSLERALTADLAGLFNERAQLEHQYAKSLQRLQQRINATGQKDNVYKELEAVGGGDMRTVDQQLGSAWTGLRLSIENELAESARVHQSWADKLVKDVGEPLRTSVTKGDWARWNATEAQLSSQTREYEQALEKMQKQQAKSTKSSKSSQSQKLLQSQSTLSTLGSSLTSALPAFYDQSQRLDLSHGAFLKEALVRCGTLTSDLGRERMEAGERLTVQVLGIDESAEAEEWALRESIKLGSMGGGGGASAGAPSTRSGTMPAIGEFGESAAPASAGLGAAQQTMRQTRSGSVVDDAASTRSGATAQTNSERQRTGSRSGQAPPAAPLPLPTTDDARSTKEKRGLGSRLSTLIGGNKSRDRSSSIPNSARYADYSSASYQNDATTPRQEVPPPVPVVSPNVLASEPAYPNSAPSLDRRETDSSDLLGGGAAAGGMAPLMPEPQGSRRKSLMPGSGLFRRASKMSDSSPLGDGPASSAAAASGAYGGRGSAFTSEPEQHDLHASSGTGLVDADGYSVPPQGYDRSIQESAGIARPNGQTSLLDDDDDDEPLGQGRATSVPKLSIVPDLPAGGSPVLPQELEAERLAALESMKNSLGSSAPGLAGGPAGVNRRATARGRRGTGSVSPQSSVPVPAVAAPPLLAERQDSDDIPLATVVQQKTRREAPPPPPSLAQRDSAITGAAAGAGVAGVAGLGAAALASSSMPSSPAGSSFSPQALTGSAMQPTGPGRTMSILSATSSVGAMSSSVHGIRPDPFANETSPGLRANIVETVNVLLKGGEVTRVLVTGEIGLSYRSPSGSTTEAAPGNLKIRLTGLDSLEKKAPNPALLQPGVEAGEFLISPTITAHGGATTTVFKYQLALSASTTPVPVLVKPVWRCDPAQARAIVTYAANGQSPLFASAASPFGEDDEEGGAVASLEDFRLELTLANGTISTFQAKPATAALAQNGKALTFSSLPALSLASGEQKLLASLATDGPAAPGPVNVSWTLRGRTLGDVSVEIADGHDVELVEVRRETISGRYAAA